MLNEEFDEKTFKPSSTVPLVRLVGRHNGDALIQDNEDAEDSSSADSDLMYEFNSESESHASFTTKATNPD